MKQQFLVGWLGSRPLIDLQVTAGVGGLRPGCHSLRSPTLPPPIIFALSLSLLPYCFLSSQLCQIISHLPSPLIQLLSLSLCVSLLLPLFLIIILLLHPFHPSWLDSWFLHCSLLPSNSAFSFPHCWGTNCPLLRTVHFTPPI